MTNSVEPAGMNTLGKLTDRVYIVTGAAFGIGRAVAQALVDDGARVVLADTNTAGVEETAALCPFGTAVPVAQDITASEAPQKLVQIALDTFGRLDGLVSNAASQSYKPLEDESLEHWNRLQTVNVTATWRLVQAALPYLDGARGAAIVNMASVTGMTSLTGRLAYCTSKAALQGLTRSLAVELGPKGIRVNAVSPGHIMSEGEEQWRASRTEHNQQVMESSYALRRCGRTSEVGRATVFLLSDDASFITGHNLVVDGGMTIMCPEEAVLRAGNL